mmetsp:Transcript_3426/g.3553  ORF Transcript_3426/g.3553 Transcript_3426/m.3553 type:complete len:112 (+) Transcript_3426:99-434(+)
MQHKQNIMTMMNIQIMENMMNIQIMESMMILLMVMNTRNTVVCRIILVVSMIICWDIVMKKRVNAVDVRAHCINQLYVNRNVLLGTNTMWAKSSIEQMAMTIECRNKSSSC